MTDVFERLAKNRLLDIGAVVLAALTLVRLAAVLPHRARENDFAHNYVSSRLLIEGKNPYNQEAFRQFYERYAFTLEEDVPFACYPPTAHWAFAPLAKMTPPAAFWSWVLVQLFSLALILHLTRTLLSPQLSLRAWRFICLATVVSAPVYWHFYYSQTQLPLAAIVMAAFAWQQRGKHTAACLAVAAAGLLKLFPLALLPWFIIRVKGGLRAKVFQMAVVAGFAALVVVLTSPQMWGEFVRVSIPFLKDVAMARTFNYTVPSFLVNAAHAASDFSLSGGNARIWLTIGFAAGVGVVVLGYILSLRGNPNPKLEFCLLTVAMLAGSLKALGHYYVFLIFPVAVLVARVAGQITLRQVILTGLVLVSLNQMGTWEASFLDRHIFLKILVHYIPLYALIALGVLVVGELRGANRTGEPQMLR